MFCANTLNRFSMYNLISDLIQHPQNENVIEVCVNKSSSQNRICRYFRWYIWNLCTIKTTIVITSYISVECAVLSALFGNFNSRRILHELPSTSHNITNYCLTLESWQNVVFGSPNSKGKLRSNCFHIHYLHEPKMLIWKYSFGSVCYFHSYNFIWNFHLDL